MTKNSSERARELAERYNKQLRSTNPGFRNTAKVIHEDGSVFLVRDAFLLTWDDPKFAYEGAALAVGFERKPQWLFLFAEHHSPMVFLISDLASYEQYSQRLNILTLTDE